jgi:hypothetical protein
LQVFKTSLALEKILLSSSKTTESGVVCFFVVWRSVVMTTAFNVFFLPTGNLGNLLQFSETGNFSVGGSAGCYYFNKAMSLLHLFLRDITFNVLDIRMLYLR